ncbi:endonuclease domain-containing protein [Sphingomonas sp. NPDC019816]|uniref:endonuclease domain-containing protein n=1 Tax=Sphingomonas sp. NPDC019816 TaxID=3390679 RepID=UPI003D00CAF9
MRGNAQGLTKRQLLPATTVSRSRELRQNAGEPERRLWRALREALPGMKFRRQVPMGPYHVDFCSHTARLVIEIDGDDHAAKLESDAAQTRFLKHEGYNVIRFANADVMTDLDGVVMAIGARTAHTQKGRP